VISARFGVAIERCIPFYFLSIIFSCVHVANMRFDPLTVSEAWRAVC